MENNYKKYNAESVLSKLNEILKFRFARYTKFVYKDLSIFDWWKDRLTVSDMEQMRTFLKNAIRLGFKGYVCFKVGDSGCANGMWAYKEESTDGYSPEGDFIYRSFTPDRTCWSAKVNNTNYPSNDVWDSCKTVKQLERIMPKA